MKTAGFDLLWEKEEIGSDITIHRKTKDHMSKLSNLNFASSSLPQAFIWSLRKEIL